MLNCAIPQRVRQHDITIYIQLIARIDQPGSWLAMDDHKQSRLGAPIIFNNAPLERHDLDTDQ